MKKKTGKKEFTTTQIIMLSFLLTILIGSLLLSLPISSADGESVGYLNALFTATTSTCVTGLVVLPTFSTWSVFGHIVILLLIQIGGLGVITVVTGFMVAINRKMGVKDSYLIQDAFNLNTLSGLSKFIKKVILGTFIIECIGALLYMTVFVRDFGARGIWISIFNSVSAFCNAGIDIFAEDSLCAYATNPIINTVTSLLIVIGGIGYIVWWDVIRVLGLIKKEGFKALRRLTLHTKIVLITTAVLILGGGFLILIFEYNNPETIAGMSFFDKLQVAFFQSITTRTAGFMSVPQVDLTSASKILSVVLMFIGGSPVGTAGGIKTVTVTVLFAAAASMIKNKDEVTMFNRTLTKQVTQKAVAVFTISSAIVFISVILLSIAMPNADVMTLIYEATSAIATVGLSMDFTPTLNDFGKLIIIATMYLGRIAPISLAFAFNSKKKNLNSIKNPIEDISVG